MVPLRRCTFFAFRVLGENVGRVFNMFPVLGYIFKEFTALWSTVLHRMDTDWEEATMARYIRSNLLHVASDVIRASWQTGFGAVPLGCTTYAPNAIERSWRLLKGLLQQRHSGLDSIALLTLSGFYKVATKSFIMLVRGCLYTFQIIITPQHPFLQASPARAGHAHG